MQTTEPINLSKITLAVQGLHCGNCAFKVEAELRKLGVSEIEVDLEKNVAYFAAAKDFNIDTILLALKQSGYPSREISTEVSNTNWFSLAVIACCLLTAPLMLHMFVSWHWLHDPVVQMFLTTPVFLFGLYYFGGSALRALLAKSINMDVLIITGVCASYFYSLIGYILNLGPDYLFFESAAGITCFVLIGNWIEKRSMQKTSAALQELAKLQAVPARKIIINNNERSISEIDARLVVSGDLLQINNGDRIPVDGEILNGQFELDESMLTGEAAAVSKAVGEVLIGGSLVLNGTGELRATNVGAQSVLGNIIKMVRDAQSTRPPIQKLGDRVSAWFVPAVITFALLTFAGTYFLLDLGFQTAFMRAIAVLVVACPCAMGLAVPTAVSVALGRAAKNGILFKSGAAIENLANIKSVVFDKTGTLTANLIVSNELLAKDTNPDFFRSLVFSLEQKSSHPIAQTLLKHYSRYNPQLINFISVEETKGQGLIAQDAAGNKYSVGSNYIGEQPKEIAHVYVYKNNEFLGGLRLSDALKPEAAAVIKELTLLNLNLSIISGDRTDKVAKAAKELNITSFYAEQKPADKLARLSELQTEQALAYVGDGINDAPALSKANVGIALADATQIAIESAQVIINRADLTKVVEAYKLAKLTLRTIKQNLFWAFFYNILALPLAALGFLTPTLAALVMGVSDVIVIGNSLRLKRLPLK